jgi:thiol-disulfide isomerase/thioredoxin
MRATVTKAFACFLLALFSGCGSASGGGSGTVAIGSKTPTFSLKSLDGTTVTNRSLEGNIVVLNFWATWCAPCVKEIPDLRQIAASSAAKVVGIALDEGGLKTVKPFVQKFEINMTENYTILLGDQEVFQRFNGLGIPYTLVLDRSQRVVKIYRGPTTKDSLEQDLRTINQGS